MMPQRFLRPGITNSEKFNQCSMMAQSLWLRLLTRVDDYGRFDGRHSVLIGELFSVWNEMHPEDAVTILRIPALSCELCASGLADFYEVDGKKVVQLLQWQERVRENAKEKWPQKHIPLDNPAESCGILPPSPSSSPTPSPTPAAAGNGFPAWESAKKWMEMTVDSGSDYSQAETHSAFLALQANGWMWGKNRVTDWRAALERTIQSDRDKKESRKPKSKKSLI